MEKNNSICDFISIYFVPFIHFKNLMKASYIKKYEKNPLKIVF